MSVRRDEDEEVFRFKVSGRRRGRSVFLGTLIEPRPSPIPLPHTIASLKELLGAAQNYSHHAVARWCRAAASSWREIFDSLPEDEESPLVAAIDLVDDIDGQFDLCFLQAPSTLDGVNPNSFTFPQRLWLEWKQAADSLQPIDESKQPQVFPL